MPTNISFTISKSLKPPPCLLLDMCIIVFAISKHIEGERFGHATTVDAEDDPEFLSILGGGKGMGDIAPAVAKDVQEGEGAEKPAPELYSMDDDAKEFVKVRTPAKHPTSCPLKHPTYCQGVGEGEDARAHTVLWAAFGAKR